MSFVGTGAFGSHDRTAQVAGSGAPANRRGRDENDRGIGLSRRQPASSYQQGRSPSEPAAGVGGEVGPTPESSGEIHGEDEAVVETGSGNDGSSEEFPSRKAKADVSGTSEKDKIMEAANDEETEQRRRQDLVQALARKYTNMSNATSANLPPGSNVFLASDDPDSPLNPNGDHFSAKAWARAIADMVQTKGHQFRTSGIAFQNLNVFGFGSATDYQKNFLNVWLDVLSLPRRLLGIGKRRIDILRDFDGLVKQGEMLVVLGPPGSGCSTLLKTIAGDHNGIFIDDKSYFNYQGRCDAAERTGGGGIAETGLLDAGLVIRPTDSGAKDPLRR